MAEFPFALTPQFKRTITLHLRLAYPRLSRLAVSLLGQPRRIARLVLIHRQGSQLLRLQAINPGFTLHRCRASGKQKRHPQGCAHIHHTFCRTDHCVGLAPSLPTCTRTAVIRPPSPGRAATKIASPGLMSARLPGTDCDIGVPGGTRTFTVPVL